MKRNLTWITLALLIGYASPAAAQTLQCAAESLELNAPDAAAFDQFGTAVSISGDWALVGSPADSDGGLFSGSATLFHRVGSLWTFHSKLVASTPDELDQFGAAVLLAGDVLFVGAPMDDNATGADAGAVYVFERIANAWQQTAKLIPVQASNNFGSAIALDADTLVIAAPNGFVPGIVGATYVFGKVGGLWQQQERIVGDPMQDDTAFGISVAVENDVLVVGSGGADESAFGIARVYRREVTSWLLQQSIAPDSVEAGDHFGTSVALDDMQLLVGAPGDNDFSTTPGKAYIFKLQDAQFEQVAELHPANGSPNDAFGARVALQADRALISSIASDANELGIGSVSVFRRGLGVWNEIATLTASDANAFGAYGWGLAIDNQTGLVGALAGNGGAGNSGSAYLIDIPAPQPVAEQRSKLLASPAAAGVEFGAHVAIDADRMVITAPNHPNSGSSHSGAVHVLHDALGDGNFAQEALLTPGDPAPTGQFGFNADIKSDAVIVGSFHFNDDRGAAYLYRRGSSGWQPEATLEADDGANGDRFGFHVALCDDIAVVGARDADVGNTQDNGAAYVFARQEGSWNQLAKLLPNDVSLVRGFGTSVAANCDTIMVGAPNVQSACASDPMCPNAKGGSVYVYQRLGDDWVQTQTLLASDAQAGDAFGYWVDISEDRAVVGAWLEDDIVNTNNGAAYVFRRIDGSWQEEAKLRASDASSNANFGLRVAISGNAVLVPARRADSACTADPDCDSGAAYLFHYDGSSWQQADILTASDAAPSDWFGQDVAIAGTVAVVGAIQDDDDGQSSGSAYVFEIVNDCGSLAIRAGTGGCSPPPDLVLYTGFE